MLGSTARFALLLAVIGSSACARGWGNEVGGGGLDASSPLDATVDAPLVDGAPPIDAPPLGPCTTAGAPCDDGNACTYGETCTGPGACGVGTAIDCDAMDVACRDFSCNGTATCTSTLRDAGTTCDDGNAGTITDVCQADGTCAGVPGCALPADACANGAQNRERCVNARVIGRAAAGAGGFSISDTTCSDANRFDDDGSCFDAGGDHAYRIFLRAGERVSITYTPGDSCSYDTDNYWDATLKIHESAGCADTSCGTRAFCEDYFDGSRDYTATRDGWIVIVADGSTAFDDEGEYDLRVQLTCNVPGCEC